MAPRYPSIMRAFAGQGGGEPHPVEAGRGRASSLAGGIIFARERKPCRKGNQKSYLTKHTRTPVCALPDGARRLAEESRENGVRASQSPAGRLLAQVDEAAVDPLLGHELSLDRKSVV